MVEQQCKHCGKALRYEDLEWVDAYGMTQCRKSPIDKHEAEAAHE